MNFRACSAVLALVLLNPVAAMGASEQPAPEDIPAPLSSPGLARLDKPAPGVKVTFLLDPKLLTEVASATTDKDGYAVVRKLPMGEYTIIQDKGAISITLTEIDKSGRLTSDVPVEVPAKAQGTGATWFVFTQANSTPTDLKIYTYRKYEEPPVY